MNNLVQYPEHPKGLTKIIEQAPQLDNYAVFGKECVFRIENYGSVKMLFLKFTVTPSAATTYPIPSAHYLIENVFLESNGVAFARLNTTYAISRTDLLSSSALYTQIVNSSSFSGTFDAVQTITLPLFFYAIDGQMIDLSHYKNLSVRVITRRNKEQMGLSLDPTSIGIRLNITYEQMINKKGMFVEQPRLTNSYNITEDRFFVATGTSVYRANLNNQSKVKSLIFMCRRISNEGTVVPISSVKLTYTNGQSDVFDNNTNFNLSDKFIGTNTGSTFRISFDDYVKINGNMNPIIAEVSLGALVDSILYIVYEYESKILDNEGFLMETFDESLYFN